MLEAQVNTANQTIYVTANEGKQYFSTAFDYYLLVIRYDENSVGTIGSTLKQVPVIVSDNQRYTKLTITTAGLTVAGDYRYEIYGQTSAVNTNENDASVVGLVERGTIRLTNSNSFYDVPTVTVPNAVIQPITMS